MELACCARDVAVMRALLISNTTVCRSPHISATFHPIRIRSCVLTAHHQLPGRGGQGRARGWGSDIFFDYFRYRQGEPTHPEAGALADSCEHADLLLYVAHICLVLLAHACVCVCTFERKRMCQHINALAEFCFVKAQIICKCH